MLQIEVKTDIARALAQLEGFSGRRLSAVISTALTRTAKEAAEEVRKEMPRQIENPTPYTLRGIRFQGATAEKLEAVIYFPTERTGGQTPQGKYVSRIITGGKRAPKRFEAALQARGLMPKGWIAVPGPAAKRDAYGNISPGTIRTLLAQSSAGPAKPSKGRRAKGKASQFFAVTERRGKLHPGMYLRTEQGISAVLYYAPGATYGKTFFFGPTALKAVQAAWPVQLNRAFNESLGRLRALRG